MIGRCRMSTAAWPRRQRLVDGSPWGRPQCQPAAVQDCAEQREWVDHARATSPASLQLMLIARTSRLKTPPPPTPPPGVGPPPPPPQPLLTTSSIRPRGQPAVASPLSRPPSSGVQLLPPARQASSRRQPRLGLHASTTRVAFVQPRANTWISSPCVSTDSQRPFAFTRRLSGAVNVNVAPEQSPRARPRKRVAPLTDFPSAANLPSTTW